MEPVTRRIAIHFSTDRIDECINFYRDALNFRVVKNIVLANGERWVVVAKDDNLGVQLHFHPMDRQPTPPISFELSCEYETDLAKRLRELGLHVDEWGVPYAEGCIVVDPIGNQVTLSYWGSTHDDAKDYPEHVADGQRYGEQ